MIIDYLTNGLAGFSPDEFPEAHDFTVELTVWGEDQGVESLNLAYLVSSPTTRIYWGWWSEPVDKIRTWTIADIPCGTLENPYHDSDQGWNILVWRQDDQIFVAEGDGERDQEPTSGGSRSPGNCTKRAGRPPSTGCGAACSSFRAASMMIRCR